MSADRSHSKYQQKVIKRYYDNQDSIGLQRAQELVTELYLSEGKKRVRVWESLSKHLAKAGIPQSQIDHLREQDNPELVAKLLTDKI